MEETTKQLIAAIVDLKLKPIEARLELLEAETHRLERTIAEMQQRLDDLEEDETAPDSDIINNVEDANFDDTLLENLMQNPLQHGNIQKNATHISLTIDLSNKETK